VGNRIDDIVDKMKSTPKSVRFQELEAVCQYYFGKPRQKGSGHCVYKTPWFGDPRVNIQNDHGKAKLYQIKQVLQAIEKMKGK